MIDTIQRMKHTFKTAYIYYNLAYGGYNIPKEFRYFMMVLFQGNGSAPQNLSIISSVVFSALRSQGFGIHFVNSFTMEVAQLVGFSYVDKCDKVQLDDDIEATHLQMQHAIS